MQEYVDIIRRYDPAFRPPTELPERSESKGNGPELGGASEPGALQAPLQGAGQGQGEMGINGVREAKQGTRRTGPLPMGDAASPISLTTPEAAAAYAREASHFAPGAESEAEEAKGSARGAPPGLRTSPTGSPPESDAPKPLFKRGVLYKQRDVFKGWRPRTFELRGGVLRYWINADDPLPRATLQLYGATISSVNRTPDTPLFRDDVTGKAFFPFVISHPEHSKKWNLAATSFEELRLWIEILTAASKISPEQGFEEESQSRTTSMSSALTDDDRSSLSAESSLPSNLPTPSRILSARAARNACSGEDGATQLDMNVPAIPKVFEEEVLQKMADLLKEFKSPEWIFSFQKKGVKGSRKAVGTGIMVRGDAFIPHHPLAFFRCILDFERRRRYDPDLDYGTRLKVYSPYTFVDYLRFRQVWPTTQRDMCNLIHWRVTPEGWLAILAFTPNGGKGLDFCPDKPNMVRAIALVCGWIIRPRPRNAGIDATFIVHSDLKGTVPRSLVALVAENQPLAIAAIKKDLDEYGDEHALPGETSDLDFCARPILNETFADVVPRMNGYKPFDEVEGEPSSRDALGSLSTPQDRPPPRAREGYSAGVKASADHRKVPAKRPQPRPRDLLMLFLPVLLWYGLGRNHPFRGYAFFLGIALAVDYLKRCFLGEARGADADAQTVSPWGCHERLHGQDGGALDVGFSVDLRRVLRFLEEARQGLSGQSPGSPPNMEITVTHIAMRAVALALSSPDLLDLNGMEWDGKFYPRRDVDVATVLRRRGHGKGMTVAKVMSANEKSTEGIAKEVSKAVQGQTKGYAGHRVRKFLLQACPFALREVLSKFLASLGSIGMSIPALGVEPNPFGTATVLTLPHNRNSSNVDMVLSPHWSAGRMPSPVVVTLGGICVKPRIVTAVKLTTASVLNVHVSVSLKAGDVAKARLFAERLQELMTDPSTLDKEFRQGDSDD
eukprot:scaffold3687_cov240-Pinguiococcus_pyrenoidosus.AAC.5